VGALQIKAWDCANKPVDDRGHYVQIIGRQGGLYGRLLHGCGLDTTVRLGVSLERLEFSEARLTGYHSRVVPLEALTATWWGIHKPWRSALAMALAFGLLGLLPDWGQLLGALGVGTLPVPLGGLLAGLGLGLAVWRFAAGRLLALGFTDNSGHCMRILFERTQLKGMTLGEEEARRMCKVVQRLVDAKQRLKRPTH
jgi:hypothetical protein